MSERERLKKVLDAGCDMFGGETRTDLVLELVKKGAITEARIDKSLRRILKDKFTLRIFESPYLSNDNIDVF